MSAIDLLYLVIAGTTLAGLGYALWDLTLGPLGRRIRRLERRGRRLERTTTTTTTEE